MGFICIKCGRFFEDFEESQPLFRNRSICDDCVAEAVMAYLDERARILSAPIGIVLANELLKDAT
jgi:hypothetical protein